MNTGIDKANALLSVGPGWAELIEEIYIKLKKYPYFYLTQVKEKFGGLRIYFGANDNIDENKNRDKEFDEFYLFIENIEFRSVKMCETCGAPGKLIEDRGWWITICPKCLDAVK